MAPFSLSDVASWPRPVAWATLLTLLLACGRMLPAARLFAVPAHYLPLHTVLEFLSMVVSGMVFALAWNLRRQANNRHSILLGAGFLAVCLIDMAHTLSYAGMPDLVTPSAAEKAINFWLAGRFLAALVLLAVAVLPPRNWSLAACLTAVAAAVGSAGGVWWVGIDYAELLPRTFIHGQGLTAFKIYSEYLLASIYGIAAILLLRNSRCSRNSDLQWLAAAAWVQGLAEMFFTLYADVTDLFNLLGHIYKVVAYAMVYRALFVAGVQAPYQALDLERSRLQTLLATIPDLIWLKNSEGVYLECNPAFERFFGADEKAIVGKTDYDFVAPEQADFFRRHDRAAMAAGGPSVNEEWLTFARDGYRGLFETTKMPMYASDGRIVGVLGVAHDITERKRAQDEIQQLNQDLDARVKERTAQLEAAVADIESFSYSVSHDLRAPLRAIDGFAAIIGKDYAAALDDEGKRLFAGIRRNALRMERLIDDILAFSRAGRLDMQVERIDMQALVGKVWQELEPQRAGRGIELRLDALPSCNSDPAGIRQVLENLLANAVKFSRGRDLAVIDVGGTQSASEIVYFVKDNGTGFDPAYADKLFGMFQRLHSVSDFEGTGVGLAIVKRYITKLGGRVWAEGRMGEGATFWFSLPSAGA